MGQPSNSSTQATQTSEKSITSSNRCMFLSLLPATPRPYIRCYHRGGFGSANMKTSDPATKHRSKEASLQQIFSLQTLLKAPHSRNTTTTTPRETRLPRRHGPLGRQHRIPSPVRVQSSSLVRAKRALQHRLPSHLVHLHHHFFYRGRAPRWQLPLCLLS